MRSAHQRISRVLDISRAASKGNRQSTASRAMRERRRMASALQKFFDCRNNVIEKLVTAHMIQVSGVPVVVVVEILAVTQIY